MHPLQAPLVGVHQSVVKNYGGRLPGCSKNIGEGKTRDHRNLLAGADAQRLERLAHALAHEMLDFQRLFVENDVGVRLNEPKIGLNAFAHWSEPAILRFALRL